MESADRACREEEARGEHAFYIMSASNLSIQPV